MVAGDRHAVEVVPAVEISTIDAEHADLHILGYRVDHRHHGLLDALERARAAREQRAERIVAALRDAGLELDERLLEARRSAGASIGRPHLAQAAIAHPANAERLRAEGATDVNAFIEAYLIPGRPGFRPRDAPSVAQAIELVHAAGGVAVWAHPFWDVDGVTAFDAAIARFAALGVDGVEAFYVTHTREQTLHAAAAALGHGLLTTGSSDFHGPQHRLFSRFGAFELHGLHAELGPIDR